MPFVPHTDPERAEMLAAIGVRSMESLFADIPATARLGGWEMPPGVSEYEVLTRLKKLSQRNRGDLVSFMGGGFYDHTIPAVVDSIASRGEFLTAYTPYQPEVSQGTLQAIFEFQSMVCRLTGLDVSNASMYDGGTALAEGVLLAVNATGRGCVLLSGSLNPIYTQMIKAYTANLGVRIVELESLPGKVLDRDALSAFMGDDVAALVVQNPDFFGTVDDFSDLAQMAHDAGALLLASVYPVSLGLLKRPGEMGADIVTGEGQSLGLPLSFGGPYLGLFAVRQALVRRLPGRVVGETVDRSGKTCYVLTLQAREQHIRREKATSNICTNQALCALRATIRLSLLGGRGLRQLAETCVRKTAFARERISKIKGVKILNESCCFNEFVVELPGDAGEVADKLSECGLAAGLPLGGFYPDYANCLLIAFTEKRSKTEIESLSRALEGVL